MINVGIVGCGRIFKKHLTAVQEHRKLKLVAICDTKKSALKKYKHLNVKKYTSVNKMLSHENIDLIAILTPSGYHYKNFIEVHKKVKSILIEKPLTTNLVDAKTVLNSTERRRL